jgi:hypothetical protein
MEKLWDESGQPLFYKENGERDYLQEARYMYVSPSWMSMAAYSCCPEELQARLNNVEWDGQTQYIINKENI